METIQYETFDKVKMNINLYRPVHKNEESLCGVVVFFWRRLDQW